MLQIKLNSSISTTQISYYLLPVCQFKLVEVGPGISVIGVNLHRPVEPVPGLPDLPLRPEHPAHGDEIMWLMWHLNIGFIQLLDILLCVINYYVFWAGGLYVQKTIWVWVLSWVGFRHFKFTESLRLASVETSMQDP